jgi:putative transcriptional regulator
MGIIKNRLKVILAEKDISQTELVEKLNISKSTFSNIVNGNQNCTLETALDLAHYLNMSVDRIFYKKYEENANDVDDFELMLRYMEDIFKLYKKNAVTEDQIRLIYQSYVDEYLVKYDPMVFAVLAEDFQDDYINNRFACEVLLGLPKS